MPAQEPRTWADYLLDAFYRLYGVRPPIDTQKKTGRSTRQGSTYMPEVFGQGGTMGASQSIRDGGKLLEMLSGIARMAGQGSDVQTALAIGRIPFGGSLSIFRRSADPTGLASYALTKAMAMNPNIFRKTIPIGGFSYDIYGDKGNLRFARFLTSMLQRGGR